MYATLQVGDGLPTLTEDGVQGMPTLIEGLTTFELNRDNVVRMVARQIEAFKRESISLFGYTDDDFMGEVAVMWDVLSPTDSRALTSLQDGKRLAVATVYGSYEDTSWVTTLYLTKGTAQPMHQVYIQVY